MIQFRCSCCGGDLSYLEKEGFAVCDSCGTEQPVPRMDDEEKVRLMNQADDQRKRFHYVEAMNLYSQIIAKYPDEAAAYFYLAMSEFGIEYVLDHDGRYVPTFHRLPNESVQKNPNIISAIEKAGPNDRLDYEQKALELEMLRVRVLRQANSAYKYQIFISFKQHMGDSSSTPLTWDYDYGNRLYRDLKEAGYDVFFSPVSLQGVAGEEYEPHIFSALQSAKVMILLSSEKEYGESVWVKNEWQRFLELIHKGQDRILIPCYRRSPDTLPDDLKGLQGMDMGSALTGGRLLERIQQVIPLKKQKTGGSVDNDLEASLAYIRNLLMDEKFEQARTECDHAFRIDYHCAEAYMDLALIEYQYGSLDLARADFLDQIYDAETSAFKMTPPNGWEEALIQKYSVKGYFEKDAMLEMMPESTGYSTKIMKMREAKEKSFDVFFENENVQKAFSYAKGEYKEQLEAFKSKAASQIETTLSLEEEQYKIDRKNADDLLNQRKKETIDKIQKKSEEAAAEREADYQKALSASSEADALESLKALIKMGEYKDSREREKDLRYICDTLKEVDAQPDYLAKRLAAEDSDKLVDYVNLYVDEKNTKMKGKYGLALTVALAIVQVLAIMSVTITAMHIAGLVILILGFVLFKFVHQIFESKSATKFIFMVMTIVGNILMSNLIALLAAALYFVNLTTKSLLSVMMDSKMIDWDMQKLRNVEFLTFENEKRKELEDNWKRILGISFDHPLKSINETLEALKKAEDPADWYHEFTGSKDTEKKEPEEKTVQEIVITSYVITVTKVPLTARQKVIDAVVRYTSSDEKTITNLVDGTFIGNPLYITYKNNEEAAQIAMKELQEMGVTLQYESKMEKEIVTN